MNFIPSQRKLGFYFSTITLIILIIISGFLIWEKIKPKNDITILYNQIGYLPSDQKLVFIKLPNDSLKNKVGTFEIKQNDKGNLVKEGDILYLGKLWENYFAMINLSSIQIIGNYILSISCQGYNRKTVEIHIFPNIYDSVLERVVNFYYYQRCGQKVSEIIPGYVGHEKCHSDDGILWNENNKEVWHDLSGGWHDAGDYGKYTEDTINTQFVTWALAYTYETTKSYWETVARNLYDTEAPDVIDEAIWGAKFLQKMVVEDEKGDARVFCGIFKKLPDGE